MSNEPLTDRIMRAQRLISNDNPDGARTLYAEWWVDAMAADDQYQACVIAHFMAHVQSEPESQLMWHLRALDAAGAVNDERIHPFYPSLYTNIADVYLRLGDIPQARAYVERACAIAHLLPTDAYGETLRSVIRRVTQAVE